MSEGELSSLRNDILTCYYRCREKGYRGDWDYTNIHDLYDAYKQLHGNSFIDDVMKRFEALPAKEELVIPHASVRRGQNNPTVRAAAAKTPDVKLPDEIVMPELPKIQIDVKGHRKKQS